MSRVRIATSLVLLALILPLAPAHGVQRQRPLPRVDGGIGQAAERDWTSSLWSLVRHFLQKSGVHIDGNG